MNNVKPITPEAAREKIENGAFLADVRTPQEYRPGHITGAVNLDSAVFGPQSLKALPGKDEDIILYCKSGHRAGLVGQYLVRHGYEHVYNLGGFSAWPYKDMVSTGN